jgi:hypothetical protein
LRMKYLPGRVLLGLSLALYQLAECQGLHLAYYRAFEFQNKEPPASSRS